MGVPGTEDGGQISITGQVEVAGGEVGERTTKEIVSAQVTRSPMGTF